ncbi:MAG: PIN domain-containing protein [Nanoarchaeota archaeon]|nr:PIN domain-containing protein [Nanoarchaeota archaeon]
MIRAYVDTNVFLDYFFDRKEPSKHLGEHAYQFFRLAMSGKIEVLISILVLKELEGKIDQSFINHMLETILFHKIIHITEKDLIRARILKGKSLSDTLHLVLALKGQADCLVTRNKKDFNEFSYLLRILFPEEVQSTFSSSH